jgi:hypothetical protein
MIIDQNRQWAFIHIPKNGGTTIRTALEGIGGRGVPGLWHFQFWEKKKLLEGIPFNFTTCRNPYDRLLSIWDQHLNALPGARALKRADEVIELHRICVLDGLRGLLAASPGLPQNNGSYRVCDPQVEWIKDQKGQINGEIKIFRLEDGLRNLSARLMEITEKKICFSHENKSKTDRLDNLDYLKPSNFLEIVNLEYSEDFDFF